MFVCLLFFALLAIFHRPVLLSVGRRVALHFAAKENLRADFRLEGTGFTGFVVRNLHVIPTGPSLVESIDADFIRVDYSLFALVFHGLAGSLSNVEVRSASVVLDPSKEPPPRLPKRKEKPRLFALFPKQVQLTSVNLRIRDHPQDFVVTNLNAGLYPNREGSLTIKQFQLPSVHVWSDISAVTSYTGRNLFVRNLVLDQKTQFQVVNIDASKIGSKILSGSLEGVFLGGMLSSSARLEQTRKSLAIGLQLQAKNISLDALGKYFGRPPDQLAGEVKQISVDWRGVVNAPKTWNGTVIAHLENVRQNKMALDVADLQLTASNGIATVQNAQIVASDNHVQLSGTLDLPPSIEAFGRTPGNFLLTMAAPNLEQLTGFLQKPVTGSLQVDGRINIKDAVITANLRSTGEHLSFDHGTLEKLSATIEASKKMPPPRSGQPYYANLNSTIHADLTGLHYDEYLFDTLHADLRSSGNLVTLEKAEGVRKTNQVAVNGKFQLPPPNEKISDQPGNLNFTLQAPDLVEFWAPDAGTRISGSLQGNGQVSFRKGLVDGQLTLQGADIRARDLLIKQFTTEATIARSVVYLKDLRATMNEKDYVGANGQVALARPFPYTGNLTADVQDLSTFEPLLRALGHPTPLAGSLNITWQGSGDAATIKNTGQLKVNLEKGRFANLLGLQAKIETSYTPEGLSAPTIYLRSEKMDFQATMEAKGSRLEINKIQINQGAAKYANAYISLPFNWENLGTGKPLFPSDGKVTVNIQSENLDLKKLFDDLGMRPPVLGEMNVKVDAQGTLDQLTAALALRMKGLRSEKFSELQPATFGLDARIQNNQLVVSGKLEQARVQPIQIDATLPFNISKIIAAGKIDENTAVVGSVRMPRSSVNFVRQFFPAIVQLDGDLALDVKVNGTIAQPVLSGTGDITINSGRFSNATLPALRGFKGRLTFNRDILVLEQFGGELAGGPFTLSGRMTFPKLTDPTLDLHLKADAVLVARNDSLTARADGDIQITGPLMSANVTGNVALTNSQFLKNIDLIPIGLPGRPAPQPPSERPDFAVRELPIRDWKFDVVIKTKDPFLIRGNLANGGAISDLHLTGTGLRPELQGVVRLENVEATLPFSRLEITQGFLYFDPSDSFNPKIDLQGISVIRDYTVHVYVYGTSLAPEAIFTSEPPLPQEEIISLLATGTTREELTGNNNVLAGRAAMLLVQQLYRKVFKKGAATQSNSVFDRLQVDLGVVDPRTGQQSATARFKLNEQFVLIGDLEVGGDFRGMLKYVIRFR
ncbi:MAG: translocation/assembly module TamB domain-containing protein [Verrucomicrobiota bacterium]